MDYSFVAEPEQFTTPSISAAPANIQVEFSSVFFLELFTPNNAANMYLRGMQVIILSRQDYFEYFERGTTSCLSPEVRFEVLEAPYSFIFVYR